MANKNPPANPFKRGNNFHKIIPVSGRPKLYKTPDDLWKAACGYFEHTVKHPVPYFVCKYNKIRLRHEMKAMSLRSLCLHIGLSSLKRYEQAPGFDEIVAKIKQVIYVHNFTGAAAGLLKGKVIGWTLR